VKILQKITLSIGFHAPTSRLAILAMLANFNFYATPVAFDVLGKICRLVYAPHENFGHEFDNCFPARTLEV
jgi:hypothetical protein